MSPSPFDDSSEDLFAGSRMSFGMHLEVLRVHLWRALLGFAVIFLITLSLDGVGYATNTGIGVAKPLLDFIAQPVEQELRRWHERQEEQRLTRLADEPREVEIELDLRQLAEFLGLPAGAEHPYTRLRGRIPPRGWVEALGEVRHALRPPPSLKTFSLTEAMMVYFKVAMVCGVVLGSPWIFWQLWSFIAAGLYPTEKRLVHLYLPFSLGLFLGGVVFCQFVVMPRAVEALLWFNDWLGLQPDLRLSEWLGFAVLMPVVFGLAFQTPLVMRLAEQLGVVAVQDFRRQRRLAWFLMAIVAAVVTPALDAVSLLFLWLPMGLLYELGILLCLLSPRAPDEVEAEEMVEA